MRSKPTKLERGVTLVELTVVLLIGLLLVLSALTAIAWGQRFNDNSFAKMLVEDLRTATQEYYYSHCSDGVFIQPTSAILQAEGFVSPSITIDTAYTSGFTFKINTAPTPATYTITVTVDAGQDASYISRVYGGDSVVASNVLFTGMMLNNYDYEDNEFHLMKRYYGSDC